MHRHEASESSPLTSSETSFSGYAPPQKDQSSGEAARPSLHDPPSCFGMIRRSRYNVLVLGIGFCVLFSAFNTTQGFMTTVNKELGYISLAVLYAAFSASVFISPTEESFLGPRLSIIVGGACYALYVGAAAMPKAFILIPASVLIGWGAALLWTAQGHYLSQNSTAEISGAQSGLFWSLFQFNAVIGNSLAAAMLAGGKSTSFVFLILFFIACSGLLILALGLRKAPVISEIAASRASNGTAEAAATRRRPSAKILLWSVAQLLRTPTMLLLCGPFFFSGWSQAFIFGKYPPMLGESWIGWVMAFWGLTEVFGSFVYGKTADMPRFGKAKTLYVASFFWVLAMVCILTLDQFKPASFFVAAMLMGLGDAGYNTQLYAVLSARYGGEGDDQSSAAFACLKFVQSVSMGTGLVAAIFVSPPVFVATIAASLLVALALFAYMNARVYAVHSAKDYRSAGSEQPAIS